MFTKAEKKKSKLRLAIDGPSGSGKTMGALIIATSIAKDLGGKIAVIDTEHGSASLYSDRFDFDVMELNGDYSPEKYIAGIRGAEKAGYDALIIDSLSHEWEGVGGCLDIQTKLGGRYTDWAKVTPRHDALVQAILASKMHIIATMRTKAEYVIEKNQNGKDAPRKVGTAPKQRDGLEYEFTAVFNLNQQHMASVSKDRTSLFDGKDFMLDESVGKALMTWLDNGATAPEPVDYKAILESSKSMNELSINWQAVPKNMQSEYAAVKDAMKANITGDKEPVYDQESINLSVSAINATKTVEQLKTVCGKIGPELMDNETLKKAKVDKYHELTKREAA